MVYCVYLLFLFFKQKTAYELRISDWSSDVFSSDLDCALIVLTESWLHHRSTQSKHCIITVSPCTNQCVVLYSALFSLIGRKFTGTFYQTRCNNGDRKSVVQGKRVSVRVDLGGRRINKKTKQEKYYTYVSNQS